ncbi:MAG: TonB-dependent receptor domain-containing protein [Candidatus Aminicenantia bacterium]
MRKIILYSFILTLILIVPLVFSLGYTKDAADSIPQKGIIKGRVIDREVKSPIPNVKVKVVGTTFEAFTGADGNFTISDIPVGNYILEFSNRFYITRLKTDVIVKSKRITYVEVELELVDVVHLEEKITVTSGYFSTSEQQSVSVSGFSNEEIRRSAGSAGDVSRIISSLPSIARVNDMMNFLVVRGGSPVENAFYIDNIEIPNINHYPMLGSTAGAIGLLNVDFIQDVHFYSGGFSPIYGDCLSSVMDIAFREGNHNEYDFQIGLDMMGVGLVTEGPLAKNKGSWMFSARKSYLDLLIDLMGSGVPVTWSDFQGKLNYDLSRRSKLTILGVVGVDESGTDKEDALRDGESYYGGLNTTEYTIGVNWFAMWNSSGYSNTSISLCSTKYQDAFFHTVSEELAREGKNPEQVFTLRNINYYRFNETNKVSFGFEIKHLTTDYDYFLGEYTDFLGTMYPDIFKDIRVSADKYAVFANHTWNPFPKFALNTGMRIDYFTYNRNTRFSPRFSLSYKISNKTSLNAAVGVFSQHLPLILLLQNKSYKELKDPVAYHFVLGFRHFLSENTRLTIEVYDKEYDNFPLDPAQPSLFIFDEVFYGGFFNDHERLVDTGRARSYGIEFMIQKKLADKLYGVISGSYFRALYPGLDGVWRNRVYDNRYIFSVEGGYKLNKYWEFSLKWNYAAGAPYTPFDIEASRTINSGIFDWKRINGERLPAYHSLSIRFDKRFYFQSTNLIIYFSVWNVFNRKNVFSYYWNTIEKKPDKLLGLPLLPVLGVEFEF